MASRSSSMHGAWGRWRPAADRPSVLLLTCGGHLAAWETIGVMRPGGPGLYFSICRTGYSGLPRYPPRPPDCREDHPDSSHPRRPSYSSPSAWRSVPRSSVLRREKFLRRNSFGNPKLMGDRPRSRLQDLEERLVQWCAPGIPMVTRWPVAPHKCPSPPSTREASKSLTCLCCDSFT